jgi:hypothetical protein
MTPQADFLQPPLFATWLVNLFTPTEEAESITGDLVEEFTRVAPKSGVGFARRWYWRQAAKTIAHLFGAGFRNAPGSTAAAVVGGFLAFGLVQRIPDKILSEITDRYLLYWSAHFRPYMFLATDGMLIAHLSLSMFIGLIVALVAKGREMITTMTLGSVLCTMAIAGSIAMVARTGDDFFMWRLLWILLDPLAIVIGGTITRTKRSPASSRRRVA